MNIEQFKPIPGFEGLYEASTEGRIRSIRSGKFLSGGIVNGYRKIILSDRHGNDHQYLAHRLVAATFLGDSDLDITPINGDRLDNRVANLEYRSRSETIKASYRAGRAVGDKAKGEAHPKAKLTESMAFRRKRSTQSSRIVLGGTYEKDRPC
jgi:hypothetical protein